MNDGLRIKRSVLFTALAASVVLGSTVFGQEPKVDDVPSLEYSADARVFSLVPGQELATYHSNPAGSVGPSGSLGLGVVDGYRKFKVSIVAKLKSGRFLADVTVTPDEGDSRTQAQQTEYDLSDLSPRSLEIARDEDGRVYWLSVVPRIIEHPKPKQFKASDLKLEYWSFPSSPMILNDQDYIGRLAMSSNPIAWCDIPGLAKIEFSLLHLKDAAPIGTLENGVINIVHESGATLRISDVKNGANRDVLTGGPYRVWVRWSKPSQSVEEHRASLEKHVESLRERVQSGDLTLPAGSLERLEAIVESGRIGLLESGMRGVEEGDLAEGGK